MSKVRIFVDFWNFQLNASNLFGRGYRADWTRIAPWIMEQVRAITDAPDITFEEMRVYLSYNPERQEEKKLVEWANNYLDCLPGVQVMLIDRKPRNPLFCPVCHQQVTTCPNCGGAMGGTIEKGVDTAIVTDLLSLAWENAWDIAVLVSSDRDFIPAVQMLSRKGLRVVNVHYPPTGMDLARVCWARIDVAPALPGLARS